MERKSSARIAAQRNRSHEIIIKFIEMLLRHLLTETTVLHPNCIISDLGCKYYTPNNFALTFFHILILIS